MKQDIIAYESDTQVITESGTRGLLVPMYKEEQEVSGNIITLKDQQITGSHITLKDRKVVNFGSCSYLGLEFDKRLTKGAIEAIKAFGSEFSESRALESVNLYQELESLLGKIFDHPIIITPTTTLGHISNIPLLVGNQDAIIIDHLAHHSIQTAVNLVKVRGVHIEMLRHNRIDLLELRVQSLKNKHKRIWYMADGIYSMFGDACPVSEVKHLLDRYPELFFYVDDSHGMSIYGKNGRGFVFSQLPHHNQMVVATSLNKAFGSGAGVMVYPDSMMAEKVRANGGPIITAGQLQPAILGAAIASAKIHLSNEIYEMQKSLQKNISYTNQILKKFSLPVISESTSAVFFIGVSIPGLGYNLVKRMLNRGFYLNLGIFPAVPIKNTGLRFNVTRMHTLKQIEDMICVMAEEFPAAMKEEGISLEQIYKAFRLPVPDNDTAEESLVVKKSNEQTNLPAKPLKSYRGSHIVTSTSFFNKPLTQLTGFEKINIIKSGVSKKELEEIKETAALDYDQLAQALSVTRATLINKKGKEKFGTALSERIVSVADIYAYGYEVFEDEAAFNRWILKPNRALGGMVPFDLLDTQYGREEVREVIGRIDYGLFS